MPSELPYAGCYAADADPDNSVVLHRHTSQSFQRPGPCFNAQLLLLEIPLLSSAHQIYQVSILLHTTGLPVSSFVLHVGVAQQMKPAETLPAAPQMRCAFVSLLIR